jgi:hypothetical protein
MRPCRTLPARWLVVLLCAAPALAAAQPAQPNVSPTVVDFGNVGVGTTSQGEPITLFNESGDTALHVTAGGLSGPNANQFALEPAIAARTISASENAILTLVRYAPTVANVDHAATLTIQTDMGTVTVALTGRGVVAQIEITPRDLQPFGNVVVGVATPPEQSLTITNIGGGDLTLNSVTLGGANPTSFALVNAPTPGTIAPSTAVTFGVACDPLNAGDLLGTVIIDSNAPGMNIVEVRLSCTGTVPGITSTPGSLDFGNVRVNADGVGTVTIQNTGAAFTLDGPTYLPTTVDVFTLTSPSLPVGVASGNSVTVTFTFNPTDETLAQAVAFLSLDYGSGVVRELQIPLRGRGVQPHAGVTPTALSFGEQRTGTQGQRSVVLRNTGGTTLTLSELTGLEAPFSLLSPPTLPLTLAPNAEVTLNVAFTPSDTGAASGSLSVTTDDPTNGTIDVALSGTGIAPALAVTPGLQLEFDPQRRLTTSEAQTLTLLNTGTDDLAITAITLGGPGAAAFVVDGANAPTTLVNGVPLALEVSFAPAAADEFTATLTIDSDDPAQPHAVVNLTGTGTAPALLVDPGEDYAFPDTLVGKTAPAVTFTLSNGDATPLPLGEVRFKAATTDFVLDPGTVAGTLGVGQDVTFTVTFTPTATGARQATLEVVLADDPTPAATIVVHGVGAASSGGGGCSVAAARGAALGPLAALVALAGALRWRRGRRP